MKVSYVIVTRNRRERLLATLRRLREETPLPSESWEAIVVDNASEDGTPAAVRRAFPWVRLILRPENEGMPARNHATAPAAGRYLVYLDDDSYPSPDALPKVLAYMARRPATGAVVARVCLPNGQHEAPAFPTVTMGGATVVRRSVIEQIGGFSPEFFRQAEEYDLSFRIWQAGYRVERFEDIVFHHEKEPGGRASALTHRMDLRNNVIVAERYLPRDLRRAYRSDWMRRYAALARAEGHDNVVRLALREARIWAKREASVGRRILSDDVIEKLFGLEAQVRAVAAWVERHSIRRVVLADYGKNLYATWRAARRAGLEVLCVADDRPAFAAQRYRDLPIVPVAEAVAARPDGVIISNTNPAQIDARLLELQSQYNGPALRLWEPAYLSEQTRSDRPRPLPIPPTRRSA